MTTLKDLRQQAGLTQRELARRAELSENAVQKLEYGDVLPSIETLYALHRVLGDSVLEWVKSLFSELGRRETHIKPHKRGRPKTTSGDDPGEKEIQV